MSSKKSKMSIQVHGRETQIQTLLAALGTDDTAWLPPMLYLWGLSSTGKSHVLNLAIHESSIVHTARLSATEIMCGRRPFFDTILRQLQPDLPIDNKSESLRLFIRNLDVLVENLPSGLPKGKVRILIVVDNAEELRKEHSDILDNLANLQEIILGNICVIISSTLSPTNFCSIPNMRCPISIHFPQYSKEEVVKILTTCYPPRSYSTTSNSNDEEFPEVYKFYVGTLVNVFYQACRDLRKLLRLTKSNWEYFDGQCSLEGQNNLHKLWKKIEPRLKSDFRALSSQLLPMPDSKPLALANNSNYIAVRDNPGIASSAKNYADMPKHSRYLLVSSYLATHNPHTSDKRFFVKGSTGLGTLRGRKRNTLGHPTNGDEKVGKTGKLKSFDQNRLKAIFSFIVRYCSNYTEVYEENVDLLVQLTTLCQARFIQSLGEDASGNFKYRCLADYGFTSEVARSVNFELERFLYRFV